MKSVVPLCVWKPPPPCGLKRNLPLSMLTLIDDWSAGLKSTAKAFVSLNVYWPGAWPNPPPAATTATVAADIKATAAPPARTTRRILIMAPVPPLKMCR